MQQPPRAGGERVITRRDVGRHRLRRHRHGGRDAARPRRVACRADLIEGAGQLRYAQTMAFTTLVFFQLFNVFNARSDERSAFERPVHEPMVLGGDGLSVVAAGAWWSTSRFCRRVRDDAADAAVTGCSRWPLRVQCCG